MTSLPDVLTPFVSIWLLVCSTTDARTSERSRQDEVVMTGVEVPTTIIDEATVIVLRTTVLETRLGATRRARARRNKVSNRLFHHLLLRECRHWARRSVVTRATTTLLLFSRI
jgi:UDP-N-acetylmuramyl pentapeptide phosphotransferase/UDP-N-acetylglucosamine-1-phosphate transferase